MINGGCPLKILDQILDQYRAVQHGVSIYFGSAQALNRDHLKRIKELTKRTNYSIAVRPSLLGQRRWPLHSRSVAAPLYVRSDPHDG